MSKKKRPARTKKTAKAKRKGGGKEEDRWGLRLVHADITLRSGTGRSIHDKDAQIDLDHIADYLPPEGFADHVRELVRSLGLRVIAESKITISVAAPHEQFERIFGVKLSAKRFFPYSVPKKQRTPDAKGCGVDVRYRGKKKLPIPDVLEGLVDAIHLATPASFCADADPPTPGYFHLKVPDDVARSVDAVQCHQKGVIGSGVKLAMPDQGTFDHPYYTSRGYNIALDETAYDDTADTGSHGTAIAANALAVAPGVAFVGIRNGKKVSSGTAAFSQAVSHEPNVISVSWGTTSDVPDLRAAIVLAVADGIVVCCACGNGGDLVFPSSMPEVISVGGAYADDKDALQASTYASSGILSGVDAGRQMPDLVGLVGQDPKGIYITLPCHEGSDEDSAFGGGTFPNGDETTGSDGWLVASGTSSATPQAAAVACLLIQADPAAFKGKPAQIKQRLLETAIDVTAGTSANGEAAGSGTGLVDAFLALNRVDVWIKDNDDDRGLVRSKGAHYISPDIKVVAAALSNPDAGFDGAAHENRPAYETKYYVYVRARNRGVDPIENVTVSFHYADPNTFTTYPDDWMDGQSGDPTRGSITVDGLATNDALIDTIPAKGSRVAGPFEWHPPLPTNATQIGAEPGGRKLGHFCLLARLNCEADPITWTGGTQSTVWQDNNIGMKNLWVVEPELTFPLTLGPSWSEQLASVIIDARRLPKDVLFGLRIPRRAVDPKSLRRLPVEKSSTQRGVIYLKVKGGTVAQLQLATRKAVLLKCWLDAPRSGRRRQTPTKKHSRERPHVDVCHYLDGEPVGGARIILA